MTAWKALGSVVLVALLSAPAWTQGPAQVPGPPAQEQEEATPVLPGGAGTLNYVEGDVSIGSQKVDQDSIGSVRLQPGESLNISEGKAEILLTPGAFLRVGDKSTVRMGFESPTATAAQLIRGQAAVEVLNADKHVVLTMEMGKTATRLVKNGLYEFDANKGQVFVYKGQADVQVEGRRIKVKGGHELALNNNAELKTTKFDKKAFENSDLIQFSGMRSEYLAEANADAAGGYNNGGPGWNGAGWYWAPNYWTYTWVPANDYYFDAFGWGFFSPYWVGYDPFYYGGFFGDYGVGSYGHEHFGRHRLPHHFAQRNGEHEHGGFAEHEHGRFEGNPPAMSQNFESNHGGTAFNRGGFSGFQHGAMPAAPAFNRGGFGNGGLHGGGFHGGAFNGGGFHGGGVHGGTFNGGGVHGGTCGGGGFHGGGGGHSGGAFGGIHR